MDLGTIAQQAVEHERVLTICSAIARVDHQGDIDKRLACVSVARAHATRRWLSWTSSASTFTVSASLPTASVNHIAALDAVSAEDKSMRGQVNMPCSIRIEAWGQAE